MFAVFVLVVLADAFFSTWTSPPPRFRATELPSLATVEPRNLLRVSLHLVALVGLGLLAWRDLLASVRRRPLFSALSVLPLVSVVWSIAPGRTLYEAGKLLELTALAVWMATWDLHKRLRTLGLAYAVLLMSSYAAVVLPGSPGVMTPRVIEGLQQRQPTPPRIDAPPADPSAAIEPNLAEFIRYQKDHGVTPTSVEGLWRGVFSHKNELAIVVALGLVLLPLVAWHGVWAWGWCAVLFVLSVVAFVQARSMGASLALLSGVTCLGLAAGGRARRAALLAVAFGVVLAGALVWHTPTLNGRTFLWGEVWEALWEQPILGHGYGAFWKSSAAAHRIDASWPTAPGHAHNGWLELGLDLGFLGLVLFAVLLLFTGWRVARHRGLELPTMVGMLLSLSVVERAFLCNAGGWGLLWFAYVHTFCAPPGAARRPSTF